MQEDNSMSTIDNKQKSMLNQFTRIYQFAIYKLLIVNYVTV